MDIGQPKRIIEIEPTSLPVPGVLPDPQPAERPELEPAAPATPDQPGT